MSRARTRELNDAARELMKVVKLVIRQRRSRFPPIVESLYGRFKASARFFEAFYNLTLSKKPLEAPQLSLKHAKWMREWKMDCRRTAR
jgi:hypothetical protein